MTEEANRSLATPHRGRESRPPFLRNVLAATFGALAAMQRTQQEVWEGMAENSIANGSLVGKVLRMCNRVAQPAYASAPCRNAVRKG